MVYIDVKETHFFLFFVNVKIIYRTRYLHRRREKNAPVFFFVDVKIISRSRYLHRSHENNFSNSLVYIEVVKIRNTRSSIRSREMNTHSCFFVDVKTIYRARLFTLTSLKVHALVYFTSM